MKLAILLITSLLAAQISLADEVRPESLMGHFSTKGAVNIQVRSGGCTWKKQFQVQKEFNGDYYTLTFIRTKEDPCRAYLPYGEIISFSFEELGFRSGDKFAVGNKDSLTQVSGM